MKSRQENKNRGPEYYDTKHISCSPSFTLWYVNSWKAEEKKKTYFF